MLRIFLVLQVVRHEDMDQSEEVAGVGGGGRHDKQSEDAVWIGASTHA